MHTHKMKKKIDTPRDQTSRGNVHISYIYSAGHQESRICIFHSMYIFSVILHAIDKRDISHMT